MTKPTWEECRAANMSCREAAEARGNTILAARSAAWRGGWRWRDVSSEMSSARMTARQKNPAFNPLVLLTPSERVAYDALKRLTGSSRNLALTVIGRADLVRDGRRGE